MQRISRNAWIIVGLFAASFAGFFAHSYLSQTQPSGRQVTNASPAPSRATDSTPSQEVRVDSSQASASPAVPSQRVDQWISEATGDDFSKRGPAIAALANAPRAQALPVLQQVLSSGIAADRQLALESMRTLALDQGDADEAIRNMIRQAVYHSDSDDLVQSAQAALDDVEGALIARANQTHP